MSKKKKDIYDLAEEMVNEDAECADFSTIGLDSEGLLKRSIGLKIRDYKAVNDLTNRDLAKKLDCSEAQMSKIIHLKLEHFELGRLLKCLKHISKRKKDLFAEIEKVISKVA